MKNRKNRRKDVRERIRNIMYPTKKIKRGQLMRHMDLGKSEDF